MKHYAIEPEVAGGWGKNTLFEQIPGKGTLVHQLHYEFYGWLGDAILESSSCYIITEQLAHEIVRAQLTGAVFDKVEVTTSGEFQDLHPGKQLPRFVWLRVNGKSGQDDFVVDPTGRLIVSARALELLRRAGISHAASVSELGN